MARRFQQDNENKKRSNYKIFIGKNTIIIACVLIVTLVSTFFAGQYYFKTHFFFGSSINGVKCSFKNEKDALDLINQNLAKYKLKIHSEESDMTLGVDQVGLFYEKTEDLKKLLEQQDVENWIVECFKKHKYKAMQRNLDDKKLSDSIQTLACMKPKNPKKSKRARLIYDKKKEAYVIQEATIGNEIDLKLFTQGVKEAILSENGTFDLTSKEYYKQPKYTSESEKFLKAKALVEKYMATIIHLKDGDRSYDITGKSIHNFIKIDNEYEVSFKKSEIDQYIRNTIWSAMNNDDTFKTIDSPGSGLIYVTYNFDDPKVVNVYDERTQLMEDITSGKEISREPCYNTQFLYSDYVEGIGDTYIDICINDQTVYVISEGKVVISTPCVTGNIESGRGSSTGIYDIRYKTTNHTSEKYGAFFNYWMPYETTYGIGLHDATWRAESEFGGDTYIYDGSHGCINLPYSKAEEIYNFIYPGYPVIVHY